MGETWEPGDTRSRQVIRSLGCQANGFELHPKTSGMSLKYFKQGRGILRSNLHFIIAVLAEQPWIRKGWLSTFPSSSHLFAHLLSGLTEPWTRTGPGFLGLWAFEKNMLFPLSVLLVRTLLVTNVRKSSSNGLEPVGQCICSGVSLCVHELRQCHLESGHFLPILTNSYFLFIGFVLWLVMWNLFSYAF